VDLKELDLVDPHVHWYYQAKLAGIRAVIGEHLQTGIRIIDVGAGSGFFSLALAEKVSQCEVVCVDPNYPSDSIRNERSVRFVRQADSLEADLYLFIDVLEHVDDDLALLRHYTDSAPEGAHIVISVPAFQSLWSGHDIFLEHRRRYRLKEVEKLAEKAGLVVKGSRYLFSSVFPLAWLMRRVRRTQAAKSDMKPVLPLVNRLLSRILTIEHKRTTNTWFGLSAVVVAEVPARDAKP